MSSGVAFTSFENPGPAVAQDDAFVVDDGVSVRGKIDGGRRLPTCSTTPRYQAVHSSINLPAENWRRARTGWLNVESFLGCGREPTSWSAPTCSTTGR